MSKNYPKRPTYLAPECELGQLALAYWRRWRGKDPAYMRITGDGFVAFGWVSELPHNTQEEHFVRDDGSKYDQGESSVSLIRLVKGEL